MVRCTIVAIALLPALAHADDRATADRLFLEGRALREKKKTKEACDRFERAYALDQGAGIEGNLAWCYDQRGELRRAWRLYLGAAKKWDRDGKSDFAALLRSEAADVASRATTVVLRVANPDLDDLKLSINDEDFTPAAEIRELVEPGKIHVVASAPGHRPFERRRNAARGETVSFDVRLSVDRHDEPPPPPPPPDDRRRSRVRLAVGFLIVGGASGATALGLALSGRSIYNSAFTIAGCTRASCTDPEGLDRIERGQARANLGTGFAIAGGALAVTSAILYVTAPRARVVPVASASLVGIAGRF